jgi:hypothetical protein
VRRKERLKRAKMKEEGKEMRKYKDDMELFEITSVIACHYFCFHTPRLSCDCYSLNINSLSRKFTAVYTVYCINDVNENCSYTTRVLYSAALRRTFTLWVGPT